jgi:mono/diheme cytochrome c family protein
VSLTRNTVMAVLAPLCAVALGLPLAACGRDEPNLETGKAKFVEKCGSCHTLARAGTAGTTGPNLDTAFQTALADGLDRDTVEGIVHRQILHPRIDSQMPAGLVKGDQASDVAAYVGYAAARKGDDSGALATAGLAQAKSGDQIFTAAGCAGCHTFGPAGSNGTIGPSLDELKTQAGNIEPGKSAEEYVRESIEDPKAFIVQGYSANVMPVFKGKLTDEQINALVDYLMQTGG